MNRYFRPALSMPNIYLYRDPVDFRKSFRGLAAIVEQELGHNPFDGGLFAFTNRQRNKCKCLYWEDNGFVLYYKESGRGKIPLATTRRGGNAADRSADKLAARWL
jgi:transposase